MLGKTINRFSILLLNPDKIKELKEHLETIEDLRETSDIIATKRRVRAIINSCDKVIFAKKYYYNVLSFTCLTPTGPINATTMEVSKAGPAQPPIGESPHTQKLNSVRLHLKQLTLDRDVRVISEDTGIPATEIPALIEEIKKYGFFKAEANV